MLICPDQRQVFVGEKEVELTYMEFNLLLALAYAGGRILTHEWLLENLWRANVVPSAVRVCMKTLRRKLGQEGNRIITTPRVGYRLDQD